MTLIIVVSVALAVAHLVVIFGFVLIEGREPAATVAWLLTLLAFPGVGIALYLWLGRRRAHKRRHRARRLDEAVERELGEPTPDEAPRIDDADPRTGALLALAQGVGLPSATVGNRADMLVNAAATFAAMIRAIEAATAQIHVLFYIFRDDETGRGLRDRLVRRAREGVTVRVLVDAVGSLGLTDGFWTPLREAGGEAAVYAPVTSLARLRRRDRVDFRNHRKIVVVDGRVAFTGGINIGREYLGLNPEIGHWRDTHLRIEGPAAWHLNRTFIRDWREATGTQLGRADLEVAGPPDAGPAPAGQDTVLVVPSGPEDPWSALQRIYLQAIALARHRVWITSPYFVPDRVTEEALVTAALRGVDVRVLLPSRSDHLLVLAAGRGYYPTLLEAGVSIYEYARGFMHAKTLVVDEWVATVGSANMDIRSFQLNFELNAFVFGPRFARGLADEFLADLAGLRRLPADHHLRRPYLVRLAQAAARLLSPLL